MRIVRRFILSVLFQRIIKQLREGRMAVAGFRSRKIKRVTARVSPKDDTAFTLFYIKRQGERETRPLLLPRPVLSSSVLTRSCQSGIFNRPCTGIRPNGRKNLYLSANRAAGHRKRVSAGYGCAVRTLEIQVRWHSTDG